MSIRKTTTYHCDVCGQQIDVDDDKPFPSRNTGTFKVFFEGEWAPEVAINWEHFCSSCRGRLVDFAANLKAEVAA